MEAANQEPENCAKLLDGLASSEGEEEVPEEPPEHGNKSGGTRTAAENSAALFLLLYDYVKVEKKDPMKDVNQASFSNHLPNKPAMEIEYTEP